MALSAQAAPDSSRSATCSASQALNLRSVRSPCILVRMTNSLATASWAGTSPSVVVGAMCSPGWGRGAELRLKLQAHSEPALEELGLTAIRADKISKPGLITGQVLDHLTRARMVIADLSFGNPNVYYELALRQTLRKPLVQITRSSDKLPFDVGQFRTVVIDMTDIYTLVPTMKLHRQEIARQCRAALEDGEMAESPISRFYPNFWEYVPSTE